MEDTALLNANRQTTAILRVVPVVEAFFDVCTFTVSYVVHDSATKSAAIIDSVLDFDAASGRTTTTSADAIIAYVSEQDLRVQWLLETHADRKSVV